MMKKAVAFICCFIIFLTSCAFDPYSDRRPFDYGDAKWICEEYDIYFYVDTEREDYYYPEGELQLDGSTYLCKFYFIHQTNQVAINVYPSEYVSIPDTERDRSAVIAELYGSCSFYEESFTIYVDTERDTIFGGEVECLTFFQEKY